MVGYGKKRSFAPCASFGKLLASDDAKTQKSIQRVSMADLGAGQTSSRANETTSPRNSADDTAGAVASDTSMRDADKSMSVRDKSLQLPDASLDDSRHWASQTNGQLSTIGAATEDQTSDDSMGASIQNPITSPFMPQDYEEEHIRSTIDGPTSFSSSQKLTRKSQIVRKNIISQPQLLNSVSLTRSISEIEVDESSNAVIEVFPDDIKASHCRGLGLTKALKGSARSAPILNWGTAPLLASDGSNLDEYVKAKVKETLDATARLKGPPVTRLVKTGRSSVKETVFSRLRHSIIDGPLKYRKDKRQRDELRDPFDFRGRQVPTIAILGKKLTCHPVVRPAPSDNPSDLSLDSHDPPVSLVRKTLKSVKSKRLLHGSTTGSFSSTDQTSSFPSLRHREKMDYNDEMSSSPLSRSTSVFRRQCGSSYGEDEMKVDNSVETASVLDEISLASELSDQAQKDKSSSEYGASVKTRSSVQQGKMPLVDPTELKTLPDLVANSPYAFPHSGSLVRSPKMWNLATHLPRSNSSTSVLSVMSSNTIDRARKETNGVGSTFPHQHHHSAFPKPSSLKGDLRNQAGAQELDSRTRRPFEEIHETETLGVKTSSNPVETYEAALEPSSKHRSILTKPPKTVNVHNNMSQASSHRHPLHYDKRNCVEDEDVDELQWERPEYLMGRNI